jgi:outer membrane protein assembly factor BamB
LSLPDGPIDETPVSHQQTTATSNWPQIAHDPQNTRHNPEATAPRADVEIAWTTPLGGAEIYEPVVTDDVYVTESGDDGSVFGIDRSDGSVRWKNGSLPRVRWPAAVHEDKILVITRTSTVQEQPANTSVSCTLHALDRRSGSQIWATAITASALSFPPIAPKVADGCVFVASLTGIIAIDVETGTKKWSHDISDGLWITPAVRDELIYTVDQRESHGRERHVYAVDRETGNRRWTKTVHVPNEWSIFFNLVIAGEQGLFVLVSGGVHESSFSYVRGGGRLFVLDPQSGDIRWMQDFEGTTRVPACTSDRLFVPVHDPATDIDTLQAVDLEDQQVSWTRRCSNVIEVVTATDNAIYMSGDGLKAIDASDGRQVWQELSGHPVGAPIISGDTVYATYGPQGSIEPIGIVAFREQ